MISTSKIQLKNRLAFTFLGAFMLFMFPVFVASAQTALSLSVSPTIFDMSANPTQEWTSAIRVINPNPYEIRVYANVVNFEPQGEVGQSKFLPVVNEEANGQTIAEWVDVTKEAIVVPAEQTIEVPFVITVPDNAPPGGHFAAMLIGTKPPEEDDGVIKVKTSQIVTTLIFLKVTGDIVESGDIRSFRTTKRLLEEPEATFELRFENKGNVHILPQGEIRILNMWGQERGVIPINRSTMFGNVLPESVRKYTFTWTGEWSIADMGRYSAIATLGYGGDNRQFVNRETSFWVIPWKVLFVSLLVLVSFGFFFTWAVKLYIRKMLSMAGVQPGSGRASSGTVTKRKKVSVVAPIADGMLDLRGQWEETTTWHERFETMIHLIKKYHIFLIVSAAVIVFLVGLFWYIQNASVSERAYNVTIDGLSDEVHYSSEEVKYQELKDDNANLAIPETNVDLPKVVIVNRSGISGLAADLRIKLEADGYEVLEIKNDIGVSEENTVIVYNPEYTDEAFELSQKVYGALLSAFSGSSETDAPITVYVGKDLENAVQ